MASPIHQERVSFQFSILFFNFFCCCVTARFKIHCYVIVFCSESSEDESLKAKFHYREAKVDGILYKLDDTAYVKVSILFY